MKRLLLGLLATACLVSCSSNKLVTKSVAYQSVRPVNYKSVAPADAQIIVGYSISNAGELAVVVKNNTDEIMIIDQTKSFFVNSDNKSVSYYDPTVQVTSNTSTTSETRGASLNLGAIAGALGIGGAIGTLASGIDVGGANTGGTSTTNTTYFSDQPQISLGPKGNIAMSKQFKVNNLGKAYLSNSTEKNSQFTPSNSYCKFSVCISYSIDGGNTFDKVVTDFYANSLIVCPVRSHGNVNEALRNLLNSKSDALNESWWLLNFDTNFYSYLNGYREDIFEGAIIDYK